MGRPVVCPSLLSASGYHQATVDYVRSQVYSSGPPATGVAFYQAANSGLAPCGPSSAPGNSQAPRYRVQRVPSHQAQASKPATTAAEPARATVVQPALCQIPAQACVTAAPLDAGTSQFLLTSRLHQGPPQLSITDLNAIEASSVGGPSLGRPFNKFVAANLEGVATVYVRRPVGHRRNTDSPKRSGGLEQGGRSNSPGREGSLGQLARDPRRHSVSPSRHADRRAMMRHSIAPHSMQPFPAPDPPEFRRPFTTGAISTPRFSSPVSSWFQAPRATFLSGCPGGMQVPSMLRVDCGVATEREFLMAGASRKGLSPTGAHMQRLAPWDPHSPPMPVRTMAEASVASVSAPKGGAAEGARTIADEQEPASSAAPASPSQQHGAYVDAHGPPSPPGYRAVHGLWRPDTAGVDAAVLARVTAEEAAQAAVNTPQLPQLPRLMHAGVAPAGRLSTPTVNILQALQDVTRPKTTLGHGCGFELGPRITALPIEQGLPRRSVPAVGK